MNKTREIQDEGNKTATTALDRRAFIASSMTAGAALWVSQTSHAQSDSPADAAVDQRSMTIPGGKEPIPCVLWTPKGAKRTKALVLMGHGGGQSKTTPKLVELAHLFVKRNYAVAAIDQPNHGDRAAPEFRPENMAETRKRLGLEEMTRRTHAATPQSVADWKLTLDALQKLPEVGVGPVGYYGVSLGTRYGAPLVAAEKRIKAAILGLFGFNDTIDPEAMKVAASKITVPLLYFHQWSDQFVKIEGILAMYGTFASQEKTLHINPGTHTQMPLFEREAMESFFARHLG